MTISLNYYSTTEEEKYNNYIYLTLGSYKRKIKLPPFIKAKKEYEASYINYITKSFGFSFEEDYCVFYYGPQDHESTYKNANYKIFNYFWEWQFKEMHILDLDSKFLMTESEYRILQDKMYDMPEQEMWEYQVENMYKYIKIIDPYDDEKMEVKCHLEQFTWVRGKGLTGKILQLICKPMICKKIEIGFSKEFGSRKNTWKGGTLSTSFNLEENETIMDAVVRFVGHQK